MNVCVARRRHHDVVIFIGYYVVGDERTSGRTSCTAADVNPSGTGRGRIEKIGTVTGDVIADNRIVVEIVRWQAEIGADVAVKGDTRKAVVSEFVANDDVPGNHPNSASIAENADACTCTRNLKGADEPGAGACEAITIPQSKGLFATTLSVMRLS